MAEYAQPMADARDTTAASACASSRAARSIARGPSHEISAPDTPPVSLAAALNRSPRAQGLVQLQRTIDQSPRVQALARSAAPARVANQTCLPDALKAGVETLSGLSMDHVRVHYDSSQPARFSALAYAQGRDIHVAPGQQRHLPHEAWHVVQQAQGRVPPTLQLQDGVPANDDETMEREADVMGARAEAAGRAAPAHRPPMSPRQFQPLTIRPPVIQGVFATIKGSGTGLRLRTLKGQKSADGNQLYGYKNDVPAYEWESEDLNGNITVTPYAASKNPLLDQYQDWSPSKTTSQPLVTPFGKASARHNRGAPFVQTNSDDYGGSAVGDSYTSMIFNLRGNSKDASNDATLAQALLTLNAANLTGQVQKNAAAKLTVAVYLAEQWRKQGAEKIWRALLRLVEEEEIDLNKAIQLFKFVESADAGREQVGRFQDVHEGATNLSDLDEDEQMIYGAFSPIREDDFSSDDDMREKKVLKSKGRLYASKHQEDESDEES